MPPWPSSMLYDRQATIAMPTCDRIETPRLLGNRSGATRRTSAKPPQVTSRAVGRRPTRGATARGRATLASISRLAFARSEQALGPEDQHQHEQQVRQD